MKKAYLTTAFTCSEVVHYRLDPPYLLDDVLVEHIVVSSIAERVGINGAVSPPETRVFEANERGSIVNWIGIAHVPQAHKDAEALALLGYEITIPTQQTAC